MAMLMGDETLAQSGNGDRENLYLPDELKEEVLCRLPVKDLLRFRAVCKSWKTLIDSNRFKNKHFQAQQQHSATASSVLIWRYPLLNLRDPTLHFLSPQSDGHLLVSLPLDLGQFRDTFNSSNSFSCYGPYPYGVVNGLVYFACGTYHGIWNPATKKLLKKIHNIPLKYPQLCGFGFNPKAEDYKFMMGLFVSDIKSLQETTKAVLQVYSLRSDTWREVVVDASSARFTYVQGTSGAFLNGKSYWYAERSVEKDNLSLPGILQFDFSDETFEMMLLPRELAGAKSGFVVTLGESLALVVGFGKVIVERCEMWVMGGEEDNGSWSRKLTYSLHPGVGWPILLPLPWKDIGLKIFSIRRRVCHDDLMLIDPATSSYKDLGLSGSKFWVFNFVESLFST